MQTWLLILFGVAGLIAVVLILLMLFLKPKKKGWSQEEFLIRWRKVKSLQASNDRIVLGQALMSADKILDEVLRSRVVGNTLGERLKNAKSLFSANVYQQIWDAHKVRNRIAHEVDYSPNNDLLSKSINSIRSGLRELGY